METEPTVTSANDYSLEETLKDYVYFIEEIIGSELEDYQRDIVRAVQKYDEVAVRSCHAIGKSFISARLVCAFVGSNPDSIAWTTAPTSRQVYNILWREIRSALKNSKTPLGGESLKTRWEISEEWYAFGFATDTGEQFQGLHAKSARIFGVLDEASGISDEITEASDATLTSQYAKRLSLGNPNRKSGRFAEAFRRPGVHTIKISAWDTPNFKANNLNNAEDLRKFATEKGIENAIVPKPWLITPKFAWSIYQKYGPLSNNFLIRIEAEFPTSDDNTLIDLALLENAMNRRVEVAEEDEIVIGCDPARYGSDRTGIVVRKGKKVLEKIVVTKYAGTAVAGKLLVLRRKYPTAKIKIDTIGLGGPIFDIVQEKAIEQKWQADVIAVDASSKAVQSEDYVNLRTEMWFNLRDWLPDAEIPNDEDFKEGAEVKYFFKSDGRMILEPKEDIKKRIGKSPDVIEALAISLANPVVQKQPHRIRTIG